MLRSVEVLVEHYALLGHLVKENIQLTYQIIIFDSTKQGKLRHTHKAQNITEFILKADPIKQGLNTTF